MELETLSQLKIIDNETQNDEEDENLAIKFSDIDFYVGINNNLLTNSILTKKIILFNNIKIIQKIKRMMLIVTIKIVK